MIFIFEEGVSLCLLCWVFFVVGEEQVWNDNIKVFIEVIGVQVCIDQESWEDVCFKVVVVVNVGLGLDMVMSWFDDLF